MKKSLFASFSLLFFLVGMLTSCNSSNVEEVVEKPEVVADSSTELTIEGMMCIKGCVGIISSTLNKTPGVGEFEIDFDTSKAKIAYDSKQISEQGIIDVIQSIADGAYKAYPVNAESVEPEIEEAETEETAEVAV